MSFASEKRKTRIDFTGLGLSSRPPTDLLDRTIQDPIGKGLSSGGNRI
jgi:hypothetical protein